MKFFNRFVFALASIGFSVSSFATDSRGYNMAPVGTNVIDSQYSVITTKQTTASGLTGKQTQETLYVRDTYFFGLGGNLAAAYVYLPYSKQELNITKPVTLNKQSDGMGDAKVLFAYGLYNMPALSRDEFKAFDKNGWHAACSLAVTLPTGSYDKTTTLNSGANRYTYKPECAAYWTKDSLQVDFFLGNTVYGDNKEYSGNKKLSQKDLLNFETRVSYNLTKDFWASADMIYYKGGETSINGVGQKDQQENVNAGVTLAYRVAPTQWVKLIYQKTVSGKENSPQMKDGVGITYQLAF